MKTWWLTGSGYGIRVDRQELEFLQCLSGLGKEKSYNEPMIKKIFYSRSENMSPSTWLRQLHMTASPSTNLNVLPLRAVSVGRYLTLHDIEAKVNPTERNTL